MKKWSELTLKEKVAYCCEVRLDIKQAEARYKWKYEESKIKEISKYNNTETIS